MGEKVQWKSSDLIEKVVERHRMRGGFFTSEPAYTIRRAVADLKNNGLIVQPAPGWLRWNEVSTSAGSLTDEIPLSAPVSINEILDDLEPSLKPEKVIGNGAESVYLYFNPNDRRLAGLENRDVWECKIGRTTAGDPSRRVLGQGVSTALSHLPILGLVIKTDNSGALENVLHSSLRLASAEVPDSLGEEWFFTSPSRIEKWYASYQSALASISIDPPTRSNGGINPDLDL